MEPKQLRVYLLWLFSCSICLPAIGDIAQQTPQQAVRFTLKELQERPRFNKGEIRNFIREHVPLDSEAALDEVLDQIENAAPNETNYAYTILQLITLSDVEGRLIGRLQRQQDPYKKVGLIQAMSKYDSKAALKELLAQATDRREAVRPCPECRGVPLRVCDLSYNVLAGKLAKWGLLLESGVIQSAGLSILQKYDLKELADRIAADPANSFYYGLTNRERVDVRDKAVDALGEYFENHWDQVLLKSTVSKHVPGEEGSGEDAHQK